MLCQQNKLIPLLMQHKMKTIQKKLQKFPNDLEIFNAIDWKFVNIFNIYITVYKYLAVALM